jgi:hypothetical protein
VPEKGAYLQAQQQQFHANQRFDTPMAANTVQLFAQHEQRAGHQGA